MSIKRSSHAQYELWYHFAWSTKYRKKIWIDTGKVTQAERLFVRIAEQYDMKIGTIKLMSDHIHLTVTAPPRIAPARIAQILKSVSTNSLLKYYPELRRDYWGGEIWVQGYFVRTIATNITMEVIEKYIHEQSEEY